MSCTWCCGDKPLLSRNFVTVGWQYAFGKFGILDFYLDALGQHDNESDEWILFALRLVANCCLDSHLPNKNRERTLRNPPFERLIRHLLRDPETAELGMNVLYSICDDYGAF